VGSVALAQQPSTINFLDVARTLEGILNGLLESEAPTDLSHCLSDTSNFEITVVHAVSDLESLTFSGIKQGLSEAG
jgi:DNA-binding IscR family transcriptional regulator